jgi:hypothetical protein
MNAKPRGQSRSWNHEDTKTQRPKRPFSPAFLCVFVPLWLLSFSLAFCVSAAEPTKIPTVAVITTEWRTNSHADVIAGRLVEGFTLDGQGEFPKLKLVSAYTDQFPVSDKSRKLAEKHGFKIYDSIAGALTSGTDKLAVEGVIIVAEHGNYPLSPTGQTQYPKRRFWEETIKVFEKSGRVVPVFSDKHVADNWKDCEWIYGQTQRLKIPFMAGSSLPSAWREPATDVKRDQPLQEIVVTSYHTLDAYGFHALEGLQALAEQRKGGETGIKQVRFLEGDAVWKAGERGEFDLKLLDAAVSRFKNHPVPAGKTFREEIKQPSLMQIEYADGLRASVFTMDGGYGDFAGAWKYSDGTADSTLFLLQEDRPFAHFTHLLKGAEQMIHTGKPAWPVERTLLSSGILDAIHISRKEGGRVVETPYLNVKYESGWTWKQPPPMPKVQAGN